MRQTAGLRSIALWQSDVLDISFPMKLFSDTLRMVTPDRNQSGRFKHPERRLFEDAGAALRRPRSDQASCQSCRYRSRSQVGRASMASTSSTTHRASPKVARQCERPSSMSANLSSCDEFDAMRSPTRPR